MQLDRQRLTPCVWACSRLEIWEANFSAMKDKPSLPLAPVVLQAAGEREISLSFLTPRIQNA